MSLLLVLIVVFSISFHIRTKSIYKVKIIKESEESDKYIFILYREYNIFKYTISNKILITNNYSDINDYVKKRKCKIYR